MAKLSNRLNKLCAGSGSLLAAAIITMAIVYAIRSQYAKMYRDRKKRVF